MYNISKKKLMKGVSIKVIVLRNFIHVFIVGEPKRGFEELLECVRKLYEEKPYSLYCSPTNI